MKEQNHGRIEGPKLTHNYSISVGPKYLAKAKYALKAYKILEKTPFSV